MNILFLLTQDIESPSGLGRYFPLAKALAQRDHVVTIAALHSKYATLEHRSFIHQGVNIEYRGQMQVLKQGNQKEYFSLPRLLVYMANSTLGLASIALASPADIIHIGKPHPMNSIAGLFGKYIRGKPLFLDCDDYEAGSNRFDRQWQRYIISYFERKIPHQAVLITTNTHFMKSKLISWGIPEAKINYLPNGVDRDRFSVKDAEVLVAMRQELGLSDKKVIAYIGSLSLVSHPVVLLIDAFAVVHSYNPDTVLLIVGGGEDIEVLKQKVEQLDLADSVRFCGRVPPDQAPDYYRLADVTVDPVYANDAARGRSPLKLFESWAAGVPFITADVGERSYLLGTPPAGLLAKPDSPESLIDHIFQLLNNPDLSSQLSSLGKQKIENYYWDVLVEELVGHYQQFLARRK